MNYKDLFHIAILLISSPARAWEEISLEDRRKVFTTFVYPMIGLCGLSVFIGSLMKMGWDGPQSFQYAMTQCCAVAVSLFGGYFLAAYLINGLRVRMFMLDSDIPLAQQFAGYALVVVFMLRIVIGILPDFGIMALLLQFYIVYVVWEGSKKVMQIAEKDRLRFTILSSILLIACAVAVSLFGGYFLAAYLINGLRVRMFMLDSDIPLAQQFAGYALVVVFMLRIVIGILPDFGIMALLLQFYIVYVVWEGSKKVMQIAEKDRLRFTILSSILLIACPVAIEWIFNKLTVVLN